MLGDLMEATKIEANIGGLIHLDALSDTPPALCQLVRRATQFEVIDVNDQEKTEILMPKTAAPRLDGFEPHAHKVSLTMLFPVAPRVGVTVQGEEQWAHGIDNCRVPMRGPLMPGKGNPGGRALEFRLSVGLCGISLLPGMAGK